MIFILDTNIIESDFLLRSGKFAILLDYLRKTRSKVILPRIVYDELTANYEREIGKRLNQFLRAKGSLASILLKPTLPDANISAKDEVALYLEHIKRTLEVKDEEIFDYKESYLHDVINRAIHRKRPCTDRGEEIRDAILWHSVLDIAQEDVDKKAIFISNNTKQFTSGNEELHSELLEEASKRCVTIKYFTSLDSFAKHHASQIDFITKEWLLESISTDEVLEKAQDLIESLAEMKLSKSLNEEEYPTGYINITQASIDIDTFYVYEMSDGSFRIEASFKGEVEAECEVEKIIIQEAYDEDVTFVNGMYNYEPIIRSKRQVKAVYKYIHPVISLTVDITVQDSSITRWEIIISELK